MTTDCMAEESEFESQYGQQFSLLHVVQTSSGAYLASYPMGTGGGGSFPGVKWQRREADHYVQQVPG
jgi:hypothetical protein